MVKPFIKKFIYNTSFAKGVTEWLQFGRKGKNYTLFFLWEKNYILSLSEGRYFNWMIWEKWHGDLFDLKEKRLWKRFLIVLYLIQW